ncbi:unnamed protein product [Pedinophyceae sp. YPF-701]|nr:unnamed protein product [Pedinophyceae sp. YPF-701]
MRGEDIDPASLSPAVKAYLESEEFASLILDSDDDEDDDDGPEVGRNDSDFEDEDDYEDEDFDAIDLSDEVYRTLGMTKEEAEEEQTFEADDLDPEGLVLSPIDDEEQAVDVAGMDVGFGGSLGPAPPSDLAEEPCMLCAGFRPAEVAQVRHLLDRIGAQTVRVVPASDSVLRMSVREAIGVPEPRWNEPSKADDYAGGAWGSSRAVLMSGLPPSDQVIILSVIEDAGLSQSLAVVTASVGNAAEPLERVLARAVQAQRGVDAAGGRHPWEVDGRAVREGSLPDVEGLLQDDGEDGDNDDRTQDKDAASTREAQVDVTRAGGGVDGGLRVNVRVSSRAQEAETQPESDEASETWAWSEDDDDDADAERAAEGPAAAGSEASDAELPLPDMKGVLGELEGDADFEEAVQDATRNRLSEIQRLVAEKGFGALDDAAFKDGGSFAEDVVSGFQQRRTRPGDAAKSSGAKARPQPFGPEPPAPSERAAPAAPRSAASASFLELMMKLDMSSEAAKNAEALEAELPRGSDLLSAKVEEALSRAKAEAGGIDVDEYVSELAKQAEDEELQRFLDESDAGMQASSDQGGEFDLLDRVASGELRRGDARGRGAKSKGFGRPKAQKGEQARKKRPMGPEPPAAGGDPSGGLKGSFSIGKDGGIEWGPEMRGEFTEEEMAEMERMAEQIKRDIEQRRSGGAGARADDAGGATIDAEVVAAEDVAGVRADGVARAVEARGGVGADEEAGESDPEGGESGTAEETSAEELMARELAPPMEPPKPARDTGETKTRVGARGAAAANLMEDKAVRKAMAEAASSLRGQAADPPRDTPRAPADAKDFGEVDTDRRSELLDEAGGVGALQDLWKGVVPTDHPGASLGQGSPRLAGMEGPLPERQHLLALKALAESEESGYTAGRLAEDVISMVLGMGVDADDLSRAVDAAYTRLVEAGEIEPRRADREAAAASEAAADEALKAVAGQAPARAARAMRLSQLKGVAARAGKDVRELLEDARDKGVEIEMDVEL